uniref:Piezo-type mechanosensitive ion channel component 2a, tandem duplicate 2 n=1 Tax=Astyanax mexicanus TaxID=7994 RepID=A0A8B9LFH1_ASTMX
MASEVVCGLIFRLLLPVCLAAACLFRYNLLSFVYLIYLLLIPLFAEPTKTTMQGHTGRLLKSLCFTSLTFLLLHIVYQITINSLLAGDNIEPDFNCSSWEKSIRQLGFESVRGADAGNGIRVFIPDIGMFIAGLVTWLLCRSLEKPPVKDISQLNTDFETDNQDLEQEELEALQEEEEEESTKMKILRQIAAVASKVKEIIGDLITTAGKVVVTILLGLTGIMLPSLTSTVYFFTFLGLCTWWSFCRSFDPLLFSCLCVLMAIFSAGHLIVLYLYQFQFFQEAVPREDNYAKLFGISPVVMSNCSHTWMFEVNPKLEWHHFVNPIMLLVLYYTLATLVRLWLQESEDTSAVIDLCSISACMQCVLQCSYVQFVQYVNAVTGVKILSQVLIVTSNGGPVDLMSLSHENGPVTPELYSTPHYKAGLSEMDSSMYEIDPVQDELPGALSSPEKAERVNAVVKTFRFIMKQSYICALIAMMAWSITYVSWLTFVFLIWSCTLWMVRDRRKYAMLTSPFMVFYGNLLIVLQYIWSFETLTPVPGLFLKKEVPFRELGSKILCLLSFWLLLRQALTERRERQRDETQLSDIRVEDCSPEKEMEEEPGEQREMMDVLGSTVMAMLNKYWIYICGGMFFFVSFEGRIVMYKIIYMMMFLFCVALYQVHYERWRWMLKYFWMSIVVYTMLVLILIYTFQFESSIHVWSNMTGLSKEKLEDLGLEQFSVAALFTRIFIPTSFLLVCILHLHYFHDRFLQLTDIKSVADKQKSTISRLVHLDGSLADISMIKPEFNILQHTVDLNTLFLSRSCMYPDPLSCLCADLKNKWHLVVDRLTVLFLKFLQYIHQLQLFIWWLLELHVIKIVSSYIIWVSVKEVSLFNYVFLVSWAFALPFSQFRPLASSVCTVWTCVIIVCKMLYQLTSIQPETYSKICSMPHNYTELQRIDMNNSTLYSSPVDPANWVGLKKFSPLLENLRNNLLMLALLAFEVTVYRHQDFYRMRNNLTAPVSRTIFHNITRQHLDDGIVNCAKYFINYFFYKFGLEVIPFYNHSINTPLLLDDVTDCFCGFLRCSHSVSVISCCYYYPWRNPSSSMDSNVVKWLYLPDFHTKPNSLFLLYDFMLLLCASLQRRVFEEEDDPAVRLLAGDNVEICRDLDAASFSQHNPVPDFIHCRSYLDMLKVIMFSYLFWFVLTIIFITGTTRISIFCMGYLVACFYFLLFGGELLLKPIKSILHYWDFLIAYNVFVITMKNILSIAACGYIKALVTNHCWLIQLFSLACTIKGYSRPEQQANKQCELPSDEAGIIWDSICFASLLLQRRVFMSYYFLHVVADIRSSQVLASRGAELFQATIVKAVKARIEEEKKSMDLLKRQMDRIKSRQQKFKRGKERMLSLAQESSEGHSLTKEEEEEEEGEASKETNKGKRKQWWRPWVDHASMVRSGNYYLFETDSEEEEEEEDKKEEDPPKRSAFQRAIRKFASALLALPKSVIKLPKTILQYAIRAAKFVYHAWITDSKTAMKERSKERRRFWQRYTEGHNILKRVFNIVKFSWVLFLALLDSFTAWVNSMCQEHIDISTVLRIERCMLTHEVKKVLLAESTLLYSQSTLESSDQVPRTSERSRPKLCRLPGLELSSSAESATSAALSESTQCTALCSRQGTGDTIEEPEDIEERPQPSGSMWTPTLASRRCSSEGQTPEGASACDWDSVLAAEQATWPQLSRFPSEADIPPSYSRATGLDTVCDTAPRSEQKRLRINTPDDRDLSQADITLPSMSHELTASELLRNRMFYDEELEESERFYSSQPQILQLCYALYNMLVAHSEMVCYLVIILNHMISASVATLVLPILIFLWAMLSVPRPSKRFWMTAIVYTEVTIVIKYFFQFGFFPFNQNIELDKSKPFHPPNIIGVEKKEGYVHYDLVQLLALFFHRSILKCHGLWDEDDPKAEAKTAAAAAACNFDSDSEEKPRVRPERSSYTRETSVESTHLRTPRKHSHTLSSVRRHSSSAGSHVSRRSVASRGGSTGTRSSVCHAGSVLGVQQKSRKELILEKLREQLIKAKKFTIHTTLEIYIPIRQFFYNLIHPEYSAVTDVYVLMFLADTVDFIIIVFGFWAFGKHSAAADITSSLSEDQVPEAFLVMVLIQFGTMVVDRALYLRKTVMGKVIFQVILVFGIHFWMFFILPGVTERRFSQNMVAQLWYFVKCIYFGLSAYQIRCGYPTRVLGNFLTKSYNYVNLFLFQGSAYFTLGVGYFCDNDILAKTKIIHSFQEYSIIRYPQPRGQKKKKVVKYGMGGMIVMLLICIVWFPLLFMSLVKSVAGVVNKPLDVSVTITLGGFQPIFTMSAQQNQLKDVTEAEFLNLMCNICFFPQGAMQFLEAYTAEDVTEAELEGNSNSLWTISPPSRKSLMEVLSKEDQFPVTMSWTIQRNLSLGAKAEVAMDKHVTYLDTNTRQELINLLNGTRNKAVIIKEVFPCFIRAPSDSNAKPIDHLYGDDGYKDITLDLKRSDNSSGEIQEWWIVDQPSAGMIDMKSGVKTEQKREAGLRLYVFSDKVSPPSLGFLAGYGIMGLYASVVLVIGKFVREFFSGISHSIMFEELPCVDRILKLCTDIFLVRETGELELEEDLYAKLIFLYRSPETMIKWTREKTK